MPKKDIVSKQLITHLAVDLAHYLLDLNIAPDRLELLQTEQQRIEDRRADLESGPHKHQRSRCVQRRHEECDDYSYRSASEMKKPTDSKCRVSSGRCRH